jgi:hypothetical protein
MRNGRRSGGDNLSTDRFHCGANVDKPRKVQQAMLAGMDMPPLRWGKSDSALGGFVEDRNRDVLIFGFHN